MLKTEMKNLIVEQKEQKKDTKENFGKVREDLQIVFKKVDAINTSITKGLSTKADKEDLDAVKKDVENNKKMLYKGMGIVGVAVIIITAIIQIGIAYLVK